MPPVTTTPPGATRTIDSRSLKPGMSFDQGLFTRQGVKLLSAGTVLSEDMCRMLRESPRLELLLADSAEELSTQSLLKRAAQSPRGSKAIADLVTAGGVLAVESGETIEAHHADAYELGAFRGPLTREDQRQRAYRAKVAEQHVAEMASTWANLPKRIAPAQVPQEPLERFGPWPEPDQVVRTRVERAGRFRYLFARILAGSRVDVGELLTLIDEMMRMRAQHAERFCQLALLRRVRDEALHEQAYICAALCVAVSARLGWAHDHVRMAGLTGLLADVGMGLIPEELRTSAMPLSELERNRIRRAPAFSVSLLEVVDGLPDGVLQAVYQHHERENGSGYPCGIRSEDITDLARVGALCDTFCAASSPRRYRSTKRPYDAVEECVMLGSRGVFDKKIVRALVECVGLFPIGSYVRLSNAKPAMVVGVHARAIDRPIVRMLSERTGEGGASVTVDLTDFAPDELGVAGPIDAPPEVFASAVKRSA